MLKAPFPWFGGKSRVAHLVWDRFGDVPNYVEPFFGSGAVLLARPHQPRNEIVNDLDAYLANFWLALKFDPEGVAAWADDPVNETMLHSRHKWLVREGVTLQQRMDADPMYYDVQIAGWWVWGISQWIGSGWCAHPEWTGRTNASRARGLPGVGGSLGRLHSEETQSRLLEYFDALAARFKRVRVCCGEWDRILGPSPTVKIGLTGVFLDPPYDMRAVQDKQTGTDVLYNHHDNYVSREVATWAIAHGDDPMLRIAVCGYEGEHEVFPSDWECVAWKANGGYANQAGETAVKVNATRERIWFSPSCIRPTLFSFDHEAQMIY